MSGATHAVGSRNLTTEALKHESDTEEKDRKGRHTENLVSRGYAHSDGASPAKFTTQNFS